MCNVVNIWSLQRFCQLTRMSLTTTEYSAFTYRSVQAAARYAWEMANLITAISTLPQVKHLEITQPAVTPDLLLLRLFYRDFIDTFPHLRNHDLVWRSVQGKLNNYFPYISLNINNISLSFLLSWSHYSDWNSSRPLASHYLKPLLSSTMIYFIKH